MPLSRSTCWVSSDEEGTWISVYWHSAEGVIAFCLPEVTSIHSSWFAFADWHPFSLQIDPRSVDVNVHPTKREVHFLNEEAITERIANAMQEQLAKQNHSRTFEYQVPDMGNICVQADRRKDSSHRRYHGKWFNFKQKANEKGKRWIRRWGKGGGPTDVP